MSKPINLNSVEFAILQELAKKNRMKSDQYLKTLIKKEYEHLKR